MIYKILAATVPHETTSITGSRTDEAIATLETDVQALLDDGWELVGGASTSATKLGHVTILQALKKGA